MDRKARIRYRRHRRGDGDPWEPDDYFDYTGDVNMGTAHGLMQPFELNDEECEELIEEQKVRDAKKIKPGFVIPDA